MKLRGIIDEDFVNYRVPSMSLMFPYCSFKCGKENCHNYMLACEPEVDIDVKSLCDRFASNPITNAIVLQGLEPMDSFDDVLEFINELRNQSLYHDVVIYTGYDEFEIRDKIEALKKYQNIIVKFGRYKLGDQPHFDAVLNVYLASDNQYAKRIS